MGNLKLFFGVLAAVVMTIQGQFTIGLGRFDITGPSVEVPFMGYASMDQRGHGIHTRQFARTFIVQDAAGRRVVYVATDLAMISHAMRRDVLAQLQARFGNMYRYDNVMLSAQHTHGGPGGYHQYIMYDVTCLGFIRETYNPIVNGIVQSITIAHNSMFSGRVFLTETTVNDFGVNRSPKAYLLNPQVERNRFSGDIDRTMTQLRFVDNQGQVRGAFSWLAVHPVSMNNTNLFVSSDNLGLASILLEQERNANQLIGRGSFIGAFSTANSGDISPNINGPRCIGTGLYCDPIESSCPNQGDVCIAFGPGTTHIDSTRIIGTRIYNAASLLVRNGGGRELTGTVGFQNQFVEMSTQTGQWLNEATGRVESFRGCLSAFGMSFAAGTTDGPGGFDFTQGSTSGNPFWDAVRDFVAEPTPDDIACHAPKPILLNTGRTSRPFLWIPPIVPTQIITIGDAVIAGLPGEITTMGGRRLRTQLQAVGQAVGRNPHVIVTGMVNMYSSYIVTFEEYQMQRYEAASTAFGPHTLTIYIQQYSRLYQAILNNQVLTPGPLPLDQTADQLTFLLPVINDDSGSANFGAVVVQPRASYTRGQEVFARFVSGNPRNALMTESSYFFVERLELNGSWLPIASDANWETRFIWRRTSTIRGTSEIDFFWDIPNNVANGQYRIRHEGASRGPVTGVRSYTGITMMFAIG
ncbi:CLUMA_CG007189, isoform A [Clunio marinus]|uniref:Neutral ceramidase n=1 Tax=Clunio marinus TaxID=568069 RepID=A0A1J1I246_9DIPT|nr:CLUMA_CG007189, isoform A [Clunio marinus]